MNDESDELELLKNGEVIAPAEGGDLAVADDFEHWWQSYVPIEDVRP